MLDLRAADVIQTHFYQEVLLIGRWEGEQIGDANLVIRQLTRCFGNLTPLQV